ARIAIEVAFARRIETGEVEVSLCRRVFAREDQDRRRIGRGETPIAVSNAFEVPPVVTVFLGPLGAKVGVRCNEAKAGFLRHAFDRRYVFAEVNAVTCRYPGGSHLYAVRITSRRQ